ncbi:MAG TPA: hypothetical protein VGL71_00505, partial [Urbifossiella sp.]
AVWRTGGVATGIRGISACPIAKVADAEVNFRHMNMIAACRELGEIGPSDRDFFPLSLTLFPQRDPSA